jgi:DNA-binding CsgD family transcriptional regulator
MSQGWPLTGRAEELRSISDVFDAREGPAGVVLAGAAGVGKTRLAREALRAAELRGALVRWVAATASAQALPLGAFAAILDENCSEPMRVVHRGISALVADAGAAPMVIGVDDAHLLDEFSAFFVHQLALRRTAVLVLTLRTGEPVPDSVTALWKDGHLRRLDLQPLSVEETAAMVESVLGGPVDSTTARRLWAITRGNTLYLRHLFDGELGAGRLREVGGVWRWFGNPALPPGLTELVRARIGDLTEAQRDVIDALAFGEPLGAPLLAGLTDYAAIEQVETRGLVEISADGRRQQARLAHPLYGEVQRAACGRLRARRWRGRIVRALAGAGARRTDDSLRCAVLMLDSDLPADPAVLSAGASRAIGLLDFSLTERLARAAVQAGGGFVPRLLLGYALTWSGRGADAEAELAGLADLAANDEERVQAALPRIGNLFWTLARPAEAEAVLADAEGAVTEPAARRELTAMRSVVDAFLARPTRVATSAAESRATEPLTGSATPLAGWGKVTAAGGLGRLAGCAETVRVIEAVAPSYNTALVRIGAFDMWIRALRLAGLLHEADEAARRYHAAAQDVPGAAYLFTSAILGEVARDRGQVRTAARLLRQAGAGLTGRDPGGWTFCLSLRLTLALGMAGDADGARRAMADLRANPHPGFVFMAADVLLARAWTAAAEGAVSMAIKLALQAADTAAAQGQPALESYALHTAVRFGEAAPADRLARLSAVVDGPLCSVAAAHAAALGAGDVTALREVSARFERMGALLAAADAAAHAARHGAHPRRDAARAQALAEACEGARTPALAAAAAPLPLTDREREIVTLAAAGLSNRQIAERLVVSVRTVEGHLYRASAKLGISGRAEFSPLLRSAARRSPMTNAETRSSRGDAD